MAKSCIHEGCNCQVPSSRTDEHCSDQCKLQHTALAGHAKHECACGHPGCSSGAQASAASAKS
jgi:hypothetical protein